MSARPRIAVTMGDPAGIGPELVARLVARPETHVRARLVVVGQPREFEEGMRIAGLDVPYRVCTRERDFGDAGDPVDVLACGAAGTAFARAQVNADSGRDALATLEAALTLTARGGTDAVCFAPLNKAALHAAGMAHADEGEWFRSQLNAPGPAGELNVLDGLMTSRVTSHVALRDVAALVTIDRVVGAVQLVHRTLRAMGIAEPRIAVCALNPHAGDGGNFGREEIDVIAPAVARASAEGAACLGPFPADTVFLKARQFDAIVTMYHDQGQIAMKLMGFSRGVTYFGGLPIAIATPAHGTAFDIYGRGVANPGAMMAAFDLVCRVAATPGARRPGAAGAVT